MTQKKLIAGNWKMNGLIADSVARTDALLTSITQGGSMEGFEMLVCPPMSMLGQIATMTKDSPLACGGQDCHFEKTGAHTGDISAEMLKDQGCGYVIVGHSERRADHGDDNLLIARKAMAAHDAGLIAIICVGEQEGHKDAGQAEQVVGQQLSVSIPDTATFENTVIAYEPVWAIGTGKVAEISDILTMHAFIRAQLSEKMKNADNVRILYGGSVKPDNAAEILSVENVDGALIGGASLKPEDFWAIAQAC